MATTMRTPNRTAREGQDGNPIQRKSLSTIMEPLDDLNANQAPPHPVACMQGAFEESIKETTEDMDSQYALGPPENVDSATRRRILLEQEITEDTHAARWGKKPGERYHPIWKIIAQISFGIHLLHTGMAKSEDDVLNILQVHIDEVDGFLGRTTEDFDLAIEDISERLRCLKLPLEHGDIFDIMLEDRTFRKQIVDGNEKIEHISHRTTMAMKDASRDVQHGLEATRELAKYMVQLDREWVNRTHEQNEVYNAMSGNAEGWFRCFMALQSKANSLGSLLIQLGGIIAELQKRAGVASRKNLKPQASFERSGSPTNGNGPLSPGLSPRPMSPAMSTRMGAVSPQTSSFPGSARQPTPRVPSREPSPILVSRTLSPEPPHSPSGNMSPEAGRTFMNMGATPPSSPPATLQERRNAKENSLRSKETRFLTAGGDPREIRSLAPDPATVDRARSPLATHQNFEPLPSPIRPGSPSHSELSRTERPPSSVAESERQPSGFFKRPSFTKNFSMRRRTGSATHKSGLGAMESSSSLPNPDDQPPPVPSQAERDHYFTFLASGASSKAHTPSEQPSHLPALSRAATTKTLSPAAAAAAAANHHHQTLKQQSSSPWSSTLSHDSQTSPEPSTTRSTTPDNAYPLAWPPKAAHLLGTADSSLARSPTVKTGPGPGPGPIAAAASATTMSLRSFRGSKRDKPPKKKGYQFSADMERAFPSNRGPVVRKAEPEVLLDIGPTERHPNLKAGAELIRKAYQSDIMMQVLYGTDGRNRPYRPPRPEE